MKGLSKSRYTAFCQCPKALWLKVYKPEEAEVDEALHARFEQGTKVAERDGRGVTNNLITILTSYHHGQSSKNRIVHLQN